MDFDYIISFSMYSLIIYQVKIKKKKKKRSTIHNLASAEFIFLKFY